MLDNSETRATVPYRVVMRAAETGETLRSRIMPLYQAEQILYYVNIAQRWEGQRVDRARLVPVVIARETE